MHPMKPFLAPENSADEIVRFEFLFARPLSPGRERPRMTFASAFAQLASDEQKRLLDKLAKLKALSECSTGNANETATAAATMTRIMLEYQIEMADLEGGCDFQDSDIVTEPIFAEDSYNGYPVWKSSLLAALAEVNNCLAYRSSKPDDWLWVRRTRSRLSVIGTAEDIESTRQIFFFCVEQIERLCKIWGQHQTVKKRNDFKRGAASGVVDKVSAERDRVLRQERERAESKEQTSLALQLFDRKDDAVAAFAADLGIHSTSSTRRHRVFQDAYQAGYHAGANLNLDPEASTRGLQGTVVEQMPLF